ncbi:MAG: formyltransferase family protein [Paracoccaceae bacterium]
MPEDVGADHQHPPFLPAVLQGREPLQTGVRARREADRATSYYVTADLDEGPIIEQDTIRVTHAQSPDDYVSLGRDVESQVLARAIHAHIHRRVFLNRDKTVVFSASPGEYASERMG